MIGLIFGETNFPKVILKKVKKTKKKYVIIDLTIRKIFKLEKNSHSVSIGQIGKLIQILRNNKCKKVIFAGKVKKPNFLKLKLDFKGMFYMPRIVKASKIGDAAILKKVIDIFKKEKIKTLDSLYLTPELSLKKGAHTKVKPNTNDKIDIKKAISFLKIINSYNYSQGVIVRNSRLLIEEGIKGTQEMLKKTKRKQKFLNGVLVKLAKKNQDLRIDLPTIGLKTLQQCKKAGLKGIVLKNKQNVCLDKKLLIQAANKNKMFILVK